MRTKNYETLYEKIAIVYAMKLNKTQIKANSHFEFQLTVTRLEF